MTKMGDEKMPWGREKRAEVIPTTVDPLIQTFFFSSESVCVLESIQMSNEWGK